MVTRPSVLALVVPTLGVLSACKPDAGLTKFNSDPSAQITSPADGATARSGTPLTLRGAASDPNHAAADLLARWFVDDVEACAAAAPSADGVTACEITVPDASSLAVRLEVTDPEGAVATDELALVVTPDGDPVAVIQSPTADGTYTSDALITFRGTVYDTEDPAGDLTVWWEDGATRLDAVEATPNGSGEVLGYGALTEGPHALELHVQDSAGNEAVATLLVDVGPPNSAPTCAVTAPASGGASEYGARVDFAGVVGDGEQAADTLVVSWSSDKDGAIGTSTPDSSGAVSFRTAGLSADDHRITMTALDAAGATCTAAIDWTVATPPTITLEAPVDGTVVNEREPLLFTALVADAEDAAGDLWVSWESSLDGVFYEGPPDSSGVAQFLDDTLSVGEHALRVSVVDNEGLYATALATFRVNGFPSAPSVAITPASPDTDDDLRVTLTAPAVDPDGDPVSYAYAWSLDGVASSASTSSTLPASATTRGDNWTVSVTPTDGSGSGPAGTASVTVLNSAPSLASLALSPDPAAEDDLLTCSAGATSDADGDSVGISYDWTVDGVSLGFDSDTLDGAYFDRGDVVVCTATPSDGLDDGATRTSNRVTIENSAPSVARVTVSPSSPTAASTLTCAYTGFDDADGDADASTFEWTVDGVVAGTGSTLSGAFVGGDVVTCTVTPSDGTDDGATVSASVIVANTAPTMGTVSVAPSAAYNTDTLTCAGSATDVDGGSPTLSYAWTNATTGASLGSGAALTLSAATADPGDVIACAATATDAASGTATGSASVTLGNRAPTLTASLSPASPTRSATLTCSGAATDADADTVALSFAWSVDGSSVSATSTASASSTLGGAFGAGDVVRCTVSAADGEGGTASDTVSVTIGNTAPTLGAVSLSPTTARTNDTLTASASASDADGDSVSLTYDWYVDGARVLSGTSPSLSGAAYFDRGDVVYVSVAASDGTTATSASSASVTIANTAPGAPTLEILPSDAVAGDDLYCDVVTESVDADGDAVDYVVSWTVGGVSWRGTTTETMWPGDTVPGAEVDAGEVWVCSASPSDGTDDGTDGTSSSITIGASSAPLNELCGRTTNGLYCGGNCTSNTAEFADAYCRMGGYTRAESYTTITSGSVGPTWYYNQGSPRYLPEVCSDLGWSSYGTASYCTCIDDLVCTD
jgi:hypothetical protein